MTNLIVVFLEIYFLVSFADGFTNQRIYRQSEICGYHNGHRKYLELGDSGQLSAGNISIHYSINQSLTMQCMLELVTCPSCIISLKFNYINIPSNCGNPKNGAGVCRCDYIILSEPPYDNQKNVIYNCGTALRYRSLTRSLQIKFVYWNNYTDAFQMEYTSERNQEVIMLNDSMDVDIASPFFPSLYPRDHSIERVLTCNIEACRIHLIFSDFQLARASAMEFYDTNGERLFVSGATFRPPILISSGASLMIRFYANGASEMGYKAKASFLSNEQSNNPELKARIGCGGLVESVGGAITMMDMVSPRTNDSIMESDNFDCIWIIRPPQGYMQMKTHISMKVETFEKMAALSEIIVLQGTTSDRPVLEKLESLSTKSVSTRTLVVPITSGFYVRLRGSFNSRSRLAIVYTAFSYTKCYVGGEFLCENQRCIPLILQCDGFNQCGDNSDEPSSCPTTWANSIVDRRWYSHTPNYYFPKIDRFPNLKTTTLAFVVSSVSLIFVISCLIVTLYRNGNRSREQEELQHQLHTISQLLDGNNTRTDENSEPPPIYEAPPNYDEIIKVGMENEMKVMGGRRPGRKSRLHKQRRSDPAVSYQSNLLEPGLDDNDRPSTSSALDLDSSYLTSRCHDLDSFLSKTHMLEIAEAHETTSTAPYKVKYQNDQAKANIVAQCQGPDCEPLAGPLGIPQQNNSHLSSEYAFPKQHLWSNESKFRKSWILFNSENQILDSDYFKQKKLKSIESLAESRDVDEYFKAYATNTSYFQTLNHSLMSSCLRDSAQPTFSDNPKTSLMINQMECDRCKNLLRHENRRCSICGDCVEKLYSPKTCISCNGRISFQDLKSSSVQLYTNRKQFDELLDSSIVKLCNCFPKYPSQNFSSIQAIESNDVHLLPQITGKSCSYSELIVAQQKKKFNAPFHSHINCIPSNLNSDESSEDEDY